MMSRHRPGATLEQPLQASVYCLLGSSLQGKSFGKRIKVLTCPGVGVGGHAGFEDGELRNQETVYACRGLLGQQLATLSKHWLASQLCLQQYEQEGGEAALRNFFLKMNSSFTTNQGSDQGTHALINYYVTLTIFINHLMIAYRQEASFLIYPRHLIKFRTRVFSSS